MNYAFSKIRSWLSFTEILYVAFFISLICAFRAITSISIGLMIVAGIILHKSNLKSSFDKRIVNLFAISCILFFFLQSISLLYTTNQSEGLNDARLKSGLIFTPLALLFLFVANHYEYKKLYSWYCYILFFASLYLLYAAIGKYIEQKVISVFFYHALVSPFRFHAVYYSILVFIALLFVIENLAQKEYMLNKVFHWFLLSFFTCLLFFLSCKLVISLFLIYCLYFLLKQRKLLNNYRLTVFAILIVCILSISFIFITDNPISARFKDFVNGNIALIKQDKFATDVYFNGLQFRLLEWKLVPQILNERHSWWTGLSTGDTQRILDQKYISLNMFRGDPAKPGGGYLGYNVHNQLLQSLIQSGIPGAASFLLICTTLIIMAGQMKKRILSFTVILLLCYLLVESLFEEQYGIVIFCFWPVFIARYYTEHSATSSKNAKSF